MLWYKRAVCWWPGPYFLLSVAASLMIHMPEEKDQLPMRNVHKGWKMNFDIFHMRNIYLAKYSSHSCKNNCSTRRFFFKMAECINQLVANGCTQGVFQPCWRGIQHDLDGQYGFKSLIIKQWIKFFFYLRKIIMLFDQYISIVFDNCSPSGWSLEYWYPLLDSKMNIGYRWYVRVEASTGTWRGITTNVWNCRWSLRSLNRHRELTFETNWKVFNVLK